MFDKFGEFDSWEEINRAAAALKEQGDEEALVALALENGLDREDAEDFMDIDGTDFCTQYMAALGKLKVEKEEFKIANVLLDWVEELENACMEDQEMAEAVRRKGCGLDGFIARLADEGYAHVAKVDKRIVEKTKKVKGVIGNHEFGIGIPDKATRTRIAREYYVERR